MEHFREKGLLSKNEVHLFNILLLSGVFFSFSRKHMGCVYSSLFPCLAGMLRVSLSYLLSMCAIFSFFRASSIFGCKEYNQSEIGIDHLAKLICRVISCVVGRERLL